VNTAQKLTPDHLHILQHSLGLDDHGQGRAYRNHYVTGPACDGFDDCRTLAEAGLMKDHGPRGELTGGMHCFTVTDAGRAAVADQSPPRPKLTRSQRMYREYLEADCGVTFIEYLKWRHANRHEIKRLERQYA
jgi:hypothetical protein